MYKGFSLIELLLVLGIIAVISTALGLQLFGFRAETELANEARLIAGILRDAQQRSITQEEGKEWGVAFTNQATDTYELFRQNADGTGRELVSKQAINPAVEFYSAPAEIVFEQVNGEPEAAGSVVVRLVSDPSNKKTVAVAANGTISY